MQDELSALVAAGLTNQQALPAATRAPCAWLKADCGAIAPGMRADLLLLDGDPLADIANARRIDTLLLGGKPITRTELDCRMNALKNKSR